MFAILRVVLTYFQGNDINTIIVKHKYGITSHKTFTFFLITLKGSKKLT